MTRNFVSYPDALIQSEIEDVQLELVELSDLVPTDATRHPRVSRQSTEEDDEAELYDFEDFLTAPDNLTTLNNSCDIRVYSDYGFISKSAKSLPNGRQLGRSSTVPALSVTPGVPYENYAIPKKQSLKKSKSPNSRSTNGSLKHIDSDNQDNKKGLQRTMSPAKPVSVIEGCDEEPLVVFTDCLESRSKPQLARPPLIRSHTCSLTGTAWIVDDQDSSDSMATSIEDSSPVAYRGSKSASAALLSPNKNESLDVFGENERRSAKSGTGFSRFTRKLSNRDKHTNECDGRDRPRSQSIDCGGSPVEFTTHRHQEMYPSSSAPSGRSKDDSHSPAHNKLTRSLSGRRKNSGDSSDGSLQLSRGDKRRSDRDKKGTFDVQALFSAVEHQDMDLANSILNTENLDVNSMNNEDLTPLDVAVMTNHVPMAKMLLSHGARENPLLSDGAMLVTKLDQLVCDAERRVENLTSLVVNGNSSQQKENEKNLSQWEFRHRLLKRMKAGYDYARPPDAPTNVRLSVASSSSLIIHFDEPDSNNSAVVTKYKVEWSCHPSFAPVIGDAILEDLRHLSYEIPNLLQGTRYYVRVAAWNIKGYGPPALSNPPFAVPSSWREHSNTVPRSYGKLALLDDLFSSIRDSRPADASEIKNMIEDKHSSPSSSPIYQRKSSSHNMKRSIKSLFSSAPKFQKNLKSRGVYLACLFYNEDRILVTTEENLPIVEVDENFSGVSLHADFHWLMKVACTWDDVKALKQDMDKSSSSSIVHFRSKLLQAAGNMQSALGVHDLGQFYFKPVKDANGSIVLTTISYIKDPKMVAGASVKWMPLGKIQRRISSCSDLMSAPDMLVTSISDMILYHQVSTIPLPQGLYLGYLKLRSTVDLIRLIVQEKRPNVLPYTKIRDCPNVSREEWEWLQALGTNDTREAPVESQLQFQNVIVSATKRLLGHLGVSEDEAVSHRLYNLELIEFGGGVNFILLMPPADSVCSVPCHSEDMTERQDCLALPVQVFEMIHMCTYQYEFISRYSRLSSILEMDLHLAQLAQRQAFSTDELATAKDRLEQLSQFQNTLDDAWRGMRWTIDVITNARDKASNCGIPLGVLFAPPPSPEDSPFMNRKEAETDLHSEHSDTGYQSDRSSTSTGIHDGQSVKNGYMSDVNSNTKEVASHSQASNQSGILRVYAAYDTGLAKGTSVKLHVTVRTTSREVVNLVIEQLNKAACLKGLKPVTYSEEEFEDYCLVAVLGARERVLRDDYQPLQLQNPWTKGRLFVRQVNNVLAALEQVQSTTV